MTTKTQRLINRIEEKESFYDIAYICEDFDTFITEISEWGVDHIGGVDFDDPEVNRGMMDAYFASTPTVVLSFCVKCFTLRIIIGCCT